MICAFAHFLFSLLASRMCSRSRCSFLPFCFLHVVLVLVVVVIVVDVVGLVVAHRASTIATLIALSFRACVNASMCIASKLHEKEKDRERTRRKEREREKHRERERKSERASES